MKKFLVIVLVIAALLAAIPLGLLATGAISTSSLRMALNVIAGTTGPGTSTAIVEQRYRVPEGFALQLYVRDLPKARSLRFTPGGDLLVSRPHAGDVVILHRDADGDGKPDAVEPLIENLQRPLGLDFHNDWLYIAESHRIGRVRFDSDEGKVLGDYEIVIDGLTDNGNHGRKTIRFGADGLLYLSLGSTCNVCEEDDRRRATMMRFQPDGSGGEIIATGLRNSVGFAWAPWDGSLYATDNGRDMLGDDFPPCELNRIDVGGFYGWPYFNGDNIPDPDMGADPLGSERKPIAPAHGFPAHNAPLGITFIDDSGWPAGYQRSALVALHGSWNRSVPDGYKVVSLHWTPDGIEERDFLTGFNLDGDIRGRPVDVAQGPNGAIYISDDYAGAIYRVIPGDSTGVQDIAAAMPVASRLDEQPPEWLENADLEAMAARGAALYQQHNCQSCHEQGENPKRLEGLSERLGYKAVIDVLQAPQAPMPLFPLSDKEQQDIAVFLLTGEGTGEQSTENRAPPGS